MTYSSDISFQYYKATIKDSSVAGTVTLDQFFSSIRNPKPHIKQVFDQMDIAVASGNTELKNQLKTHLFSFTPAVQIAGSRKYDNIQNFTGLMPLDFDKLPDNQAVELKEHLFYDYPFIIASWLSASKRGVRALVNIPIVQTVDEYKAYFEGLQHYSDIGKYINFDTAPKNCVLPLFLSYDPDLLSGDTTVVWERKYKPFIPPPVVQYKYDANPNKVYQHIQTAINKIVDNGHPQLRSAAYALGGFVGAGYISKVEAIDLIKNLIDGNSYLSQKADVYKATAKTMINNGLNKSLYL